MKPIEAVFIGALLGALVGGGATFLLCYSHSRAFRRLRRLNVWRRFMLTSFPEWSR